jgi:hypothetical protein
MNPSSCCSLENSAALSSATAPARAPRLTRLLDFVIRHAGAVAVDHTHILPLDRVSGRTGIVQPAPARRDCY